jgi:hypothetical protein
MEVFMPKKTNYSNNPLRIGVDGTKLLFQKAPMVAIVLAVLSAFGAGGNFSDPSAKPDNAAIPADTALDPTLLTILVIVVAILLFGLILIGSFVAGIFAYTSVEVAKGREVTFRQAVKAISKRFWSFVGLQLLTIGKVLLWALLFVIPGIVMAFRYSLANLSFFDDEKKLTGSAAIKDSLELTKGAWVTTFASQTILNIVTIGSISLIVDTGSKAMLYRQFSELQETGGQKPKPHTLSWVTLGLVLLVTAVAVSLLGFALVNYGLSTIEG